MSQGPLKKRSLLTTALALAGGIAALFDPVAAMARARDLNSLSAAERTTLVGLMLEYINDARVDFHRHHVVHRDVTLFTHHTAMIRELEDFLVARGFSQFVPLPTWNPANPIPDEFFVVKPFDNGTFSRVVNGQVETRPALQDRTPNLPKPVDFAHPQICSFTDGNVLGNEMNGWHGSVHCGIGGTMCDIRQSPAAPIFWNWHAYVSEMFYDDFNHCLGWRDIGHATEVVGLAAMNGKLYAATSDNKLWVRDAVLSEVDWREIGHATGVVAMTGLGGRLYAATSDNKLWVREATDANVDWTQIGHADGIVAMTSHDGKLYAANGANQLWMRDAVHADVAWTLIGHADNAVGLASAGPKLYGSSTGGTLWMRSPYATDVPWEKIGAAGVGGRPGGMAADGGRLFVVTSNNRILVRDLLPF
jgi:hypothetical protein